MTGIFHSNNSKTFCGLKHLCQESKIGVSYASWEFGGGTNNCKEAYILNIEVIFSYLIYLFTRDDSFAVCSLKKVS